MIDPMTYAFDTELAAALDLLPKIDVSDIPAARATLEELNGELAQPDAAGVEEREVRIPGPDGAPDVLLLLYVPEQRSGTGAVYDVHGGGFILGSAGGNRAHNLLLARELGVVVASVDYRLAPEHPFPAGLEDCYAGLSWLTSHADELGFDPSRIAIHGISAGGGLCAALALLARDRGGPAIAFQYLGVPEVDDRLDTPSMREFVDTPIWNRPNAVVSWDSYLGAGVPGTAAVSPYAAPARATDLTGLPPAYVSVMQFDPLRDEGLAYALALLAAGDAVELHLFPGTFHGSSLLEEARVSRRELDEAVTVLRNFVG
jgi:acetyl esterase/lipase